MNEIDRLRREVDQLSSRIAALENAAGDSPTPSQIDRPSEPLARPPHSPPTSPPTTPASAAPFSTMPPAPSHREKSKTFAQHRNLSALDLSRIHDDQDSPFDLEKFVGVRAFAVIGALIVIAGVAFFLKIAWDQGWIGQIPNVWKAILGALFGFALLGAGEIALRRAGAIAASGLNAAGLGVVYATSYASYSNLDLLPRPAAFIALAITTAIGVAISIRSRLAVVAALAIIAGFLTPALLVRDTPPPTGVLPAYLLMLLTTALILSYHFRAAFTAVRSIGFWGLALTGSFWILDSGPDHPFIALLFIAVVWAVVHLEIIATARRLSLSTLPIDEAARDQEPPTADLDLRSVRPLLSSLSTTSWAVGMAILTIHTTSLADSDWIVPAAAFAATAHLALILAGSLRVLRDEPRNEIERVGAVFAASAGALAALTVAMAFTDWTQAGAWFVFALAAAAGSRWIKAPSLFVYAIVVASFGVLRLATLGWWQTTPEFNNFGIAGSRYTLLVLFAAATWMTIAALRPKTSKDWVQILQTLCVAAGLLLLYLAPLHIESQRPSLAVLWLIMSAALVASRRLAPLFYLDRFALLGMLSVVFMWTLSADQDEWLSGQPHLIFNMPMLAAAAVTALSFFVGWRLLRFEKDTDTGRALGALAVVGSLVWIFGVTTYEATLIAQRSFHDPTAQRAIVSLWWALFATPMLLIGFRIKHAASRGVALALIFAAAAKTVVFDLAELAPAWRVAAFLGVGILMLAVAVGYAISARRLSASTKPAD